MKDLLFAIGALGFGTTLVACVFMTVWWGLNKDHDIAAPAPPVAPVGFWSDTGALVIPGPDGVSRPELERVAA